MQVYYHLGEFEESLTFALGAGKLFDTTAKNEYVETIIGMLDTSCFAVLALIILPDSQVYR